MVLPIALIAAAPEVIIAGAVLLVLYATQILWVKPLSFLLSQIPVVGAQLAGNLQRGAQAATDWAAGWARSGLDALVQLVSAPVQQATSFLGSLVATVETAGQRILDLFGAIGSLGLTIVHDVIALAGQIAGVVVSIGTLAAAIPGRITAIAGKLVDDAVTGVRRLIAATSAGLTAAIAAERAALIASHGDLLSIIRAQAGVSASALAATAIALRQEWAGQLGGVTAELDQLGQLVRPIAAAGLLTLVPAIAQELTQLRTECVDPICEVTTPQLPMLSALADIGTVMIVGGIVGAAIADPEDTARATAAVAGDVIGLASGLFSAFTGQHA